MTAPADLGRVFRIDPPHIARTAGNSGAFEGFFERIEGICGLRPIGGERLAFVRRNGKAFARDRSGDH
jgi:hypothetical protein